MGVTKDHKGIEIEKFIIYRSWRRYVACLQGPQRDFKARCGQDLRSCISDERPGDADP